MSRPWCRTLLHSAIVGLIGIFVGVVIESAQATISGLVGTKTIDVF